MTAPYEIDFQRLEPSEDNPYPLGRNVKHDSRSRGFAFVDEHPETAAIDVEIEWPLGIPVLDQADIGACTGDSGTEAQSCTYDDKVMWATEGGATSELLALDQRFAYHLYADATAVDGYQGTFTYPPPGGDDTGSDALSIAKVYKARGSIDKFTHGFGLNDCKVMIQHGGFMVGMEWTDGMFYPDANGIVTVSGALAGGHELFVFGRKQYFKHLGDTKWYWKIRNHWAEDWGDNGCCYMSDDTLAERLSKDGDATFLHFVVKTVPPAPPEPPPFSWRSILTWFFTWFDRLVGTLTKFRSRG